MQSAYSEQLGYLALWHSDTKELEVDFRIAGKGINKFPPIFIARLPMLTDQGKCHNCEHPGRAYRRRLIDSDATKRYVSGRIGHLGIYTDHDKLIIAREISATAKLSILNHTQR